MTGLSSHPFELFVFHRDLEADLACVEGGASGVVVDLEVRGKKRRQQGFDTQINLHTLDDLRQVKRRLGVHVICRVNPFDPGDPGEILAAVAAGADEILVPMIRRLEEAEAVLELVDGACPVDLMIETEEAVTIAARLARLPLGRVYVGLNDLQICRRSPSLFTAIYDLTVEKVRRHFTAVPFGFGGLTLPGRGTPLPVEHLIHEMARLRCRFTFLRRSFFRDSTGHSPQREIPRILGALEAAFARTEAEVERHRRACWRDLESLVEVPA